MRRQTFRTMARLLRQLSLTKSAIESRHIADEIKQVVEAYQTHEEYRTHIALPLEIKDGWRTW